MYEYYIVLMRKSDKVIVVSYTYEYPPPQVSYSIKHPPPPDMHKKISTFRSEPEPIFQHTLMTQEFTLDKWFLTCAPRTLPRASAAAPEKQNK